MKTVISIGSLIVLLSVSSLVWAGERMLSSEPVDFHRDAFIKADERGNIWTAYYDLQGRIHINNVTESKDIIVNSESSDVSSGLALDIQGEHIFVAWRQKLGEKKLWFRSSPDGGKTFSEPVLIDEATDALTRIKLGSNAKGEVYVAWYGEKTSGNAKYHIYCRSSRDFGKTFLETVNITDGYQFSIYPALLVDEDGAYAFSYSIGMKDQRRYMVFRKTTDGGSTWSKPLEIRAIGEVSLFVEPIKVGKRLHVFWFNAYEIGSEDVPIIEEAYSDDAGKTWQVQSLQETRGLGIASLKVAHDTKGHIYLAFEEKKEEELKMKSYLLSSDDNGASWGKLMNVRHYPFEVTQTLNPEVVVSDTGQVVLVWADYRNIRGNLYMQHSKDFGNTWQERDIPLEEPGKFNTRQFPAGNTLLQFEDRYYDLAYRFKSDDLSQEAYPLLVDFTLNTMATPDMSKRETADDTDSPSRVSLLKQRASEFWDARVKKDYEKEFSLYDPFFQAVMNKYAFMGNMGKILYHTFEIKEIKLQGNVAWVTINIVYSIPKLKVKKQEFFKGETPAEFQERWLYIDNNWYREYYNEQAEKGVAEY